MKFVKFLNWKGLLIVAMVVLIGAAWVVYYHHRASPKVTSNLSPNALPRPYAIPQQNAFATQPGAPANVQQTLQTIQEINRINQMNQQNRQNNPPNQPK